MKEQKVLLFSWYFAPYINTTGLSIYKNLLKCHNKFIVVQAKDTVYDENLMEFDQENIFERREIVQNHAVLTAEGMEKANKVKIIMSLVLYILRGIKIYWQEKKQIKLIMSNSAEYISHIPALIIKLFSRKTKWIAVFTDSLNGNPYFQYDEHYQTPIIKLYTWFFKKIEYFSLVKADEIVFLNEYQSNHTLSKLNFRKDITSKITYIQNSYLADAFESIETTENFFNSEIKCNFSHVGSIYGRRSLKVLIMAVDYLSEKQMIHEGDVVFNIVGKIKEAEMQMITEYNNKFFNFIKPVPYLTSLQIMLQSDVLLLIDGLFTETEENVFMAGKLADYFGAEKPILALTMAKGITTDLMIKTQNEIHTNEDSVELAMKILKFINQEVQPNYVEYKRYNSQLASQKFDQLIHQCGQKGGK